MAKPVVDRLEAELVPVRLVRISVMTSPGSDLARHFGVRGVPTLLVVDGEGEVVLRQTGRIQKDPVISAIAALAE